ncbi:MAG TPA: response regulator transcription factor [Vicinamibacteria bacterium]|nr:response regulator transcription factor [Vicinamibacteria bacterium]
MRPEARKARVLVVEDEEAIRTGLEDILVYHGHEVESAETGEAGLRRLQDPPPVDLVLLDVMLPGLSGFDLCRRLREGGKTLPVLMLTAKGSEDDVVEGLRSGADDYVTKPFSLRELIARVEALLRRVAPVEPRNGVLEFGGFRIDRASLSAEQADLRCDLTPRELALIEVFVRERGRIVSRRTLLQDVWGMHRVDEVETRTVDVHIAKLRKKVDPDAQLIETIRGAGYRFRG